MPERHVYDYVTLSLTRVNKIGMKKERLHKKWHYFINCFFNCLTYSRLPSTEGSNEVTVSGRKKLPTIKPGMSSQFYIQHEGLRLAPLFTKYLHIVIIS